MFRPTLLGTMASREIDQLAAFHHPAGGTELQGGLQGTASGAAQGGIGTDKVGVGGAIGFLGRFHRFLQAISWGSTPVLS
jgi:hypothetical protein